MGSTRAKDLSDNTDNYFRYKHPYETEILHLKYPDSIYQKNEPIPYLPVESTSAIFVDTEEGVLEMLSELKGATEIAVDLEHHDTRSYVGLVSLMQISTRDKDWIVDTLKPWRQNLQVLNEVFADPRIVKVRQFVVLCRRHQISNNARCFMEHIWISSGFSVTLVCMLLDSLILIGLAELSDMQEGVLPFC